MTNLQSVIVTRSGIALVGLAVLWFCVAATLPNVLFRSDAEAAQRFGLASAQVRGALASGLLAEWSPPAEKVRRAKQLAIAALREDPTSVTGARALGTAAAIANDEGRAERLFRYAELLSRRDFGTQVWMIERSVAKGDVVGALHHYDRALRTNARAPEILFPVLLSAAGAPEIMVPLGNLLATRPAWWRWFMVALVEDPSAQPAAMAYLVSRTRLRSDVPIEHDLLVRFIGRLVEGGEFRLAATLVPGRGTGPELVRNGGFENEPALPPFDWEISQEVDLTATREPLERGFVLRLIASDAHSGRVARQLLLLAPGSYRLRFRSGNSGAGEQEHAAVSVQCARKDGPELARFNPAPSGAEGTAVQGDFVVPQGCDGQWLEVLAQSGSDSNSEGPWVDDLSIQRR